MPDHAGPMARSRSPRRPLAAALVLLAVACAVGGRTLDDPSRLGSLRARMGLLAADRALADSASRIGVGPALAASLDPDAVVLLPGAPVVAGGAEARRALAPLVARATWVPLHAELSADSTIGATHGVLMRADGGAGAQGKYLAVWRRASAGWRLASWVATAGLASIGEPPAGTTLPPLAQDGAARAVADADRAFAAHAERDDAATAFEAFAAPDATLFPGTGDIARGPADIAARLRDYARVTRWRWAPVVAVAAASGDFGYTVGEAVIAPREGASGATAYSKYLTVWRRQPDGRWRFVADAGNARPAPR